MDNINSLGLDILKAGAHEDFIPTEQIYTGKKYSKSANGYQCLGQCVTKNKKIIHPITLETVTDKDNSFCPVAGYETINDKTNKKEIKDREIEKNEMLLEQKKIHL